MKKSTKGFILGAVLATGAAAGVYAAKKTGYLDKAIDYVKKLTTKKDDEDDIFDDEDAAIIDAEKFTAPNEGEDEGDAEIATEEREYVYLAFDTEAADTLKDEVAKEAVDAEEASEETAPAEETVEETAPVEEVADAEETSEETAAPEEGEGRKNKKK